MDKSEDINYDDPADRHSYLAQLLLTDQKHISFTVGSLTGLPQKSEGIHLMLTTFSQAAHDSHMELEFSVHFKLPGTQKAGKREASLFINKCNIDLEIGPSLQSLAEIEKEEPHKFTQIVEQFSIPSTVVDRDLEPLHIVTIPYNPQMKYARNLWTNEDCGSQAVAFDKIKDVLYYNPFELKLLLMGYTLPKSLTKIFQDYRHQSKHDPLLRWFAGNQYLRSPAPLSGVWCNDLPVSRRPKHIVNSKVSFFSVQEYVTINGYAMQYEHEIASAPYQKRYTVWMKIFTVPQGGNRIYWSFFSLAHDELHLKKGDKIRVNLNPMKDIQSTDWDDCTVVEVTSAGEKSNVIVIMNRPWDKQTGKFKMFDPDINPNLTKELKNIKNVAGAATQAPAQSVIISAKFSTRQHIRQCHALTSLQTSERDLNWKVLLANEVGSLPRYDIYRDVPGDSSKKLDFIDAFAHNFSEEQKQAYNTSRDLSGGLMIINGTAGSGKSRWIVQVSQPLLNSFHLDKLGEALPYQVLLIAATNETVDDLAFNLDRTTSINRRKLELNPPIIVRWYGARTDDTIFLRDPNKKRAYRERNPVPSRLNESEEGCLDLAAMAHIHKVYKTATTNKHGIADRRVRHLRLSTGWWMLRIMGLGEHGKQDPLYDGENFSELRKVLEEYEAGHDFARRDDGQAAALTKRFNEKMGNLRDYLLERACAVVTTPFNAGDPDLYRAFEPSLIQVDEASKLTESEIWSLFAFYKPSVRVFLGDSKQLKSTCQSDQFCNPFYAQLVKTPFDRLQEAGFTTFNFVKQHRYITAICDLVSPIFYNNTLETVGNVDISVGANAALKAMIQVFGKRTPLMFVDVKNSVCSETKSKDNKVHVGVVLSIVESFIKAGINPLDIGIESPYLNQVNLITRGIELLQEEQPEKDFTETLVSTVDGAQGKERSIIICDLTVGSVLGFIKEDARLCVAMTRARHALIVIGNRSEMEKSREWKDAWYWEDGEQHYKPEIKLKSVLSHFIDRKLIYTWPGKGIPPKFQSVVENAH